jgi:hypothetical protein
VDEWVMAPAAATVAEEPPGPVAWRPEDDDILPKLGTSRRLLSLNLSLRR